MSYFPAGGRGGEWGGGRGRVWERRRGWVVEGKIVEGRGRG